MTQVGIKSLIGFMTTKELIGATDAAVLLGLSRAGFNLKCQRGEIMTAGRIGKRGIRVFDRAEIDRLAAERMGAHDER